jgi:hypothetical protein
VGDGVDVIVGVGKISGQVKFIHFAPTEKVTVGSDWGSLPQPK